MHQRFHQSQLTSTAGHELGALDRGAHRGRQAADSVRAHAYDREPSLVARFIAMHIE
jgi:hypothetical protein